MASEFQPRIEIAFDCLPLRSVGRLDVPLDASDAFRRRAEQMKSAIAEFGVERTYYLYNAFCVFRFANSDVDGVCRFEFEGVVRTDAGDRLCQQSLVHAWLVSETCGGVPAAVEGWLAERVRSAVAIEFDRFIAAGQLAQRTTELGTIANLTELGGLSGLDV